MDLLTSMRVFTRVVEFESFARAARSEGLSPAMVSKHVAALEARLGVTLLARTTRRVRPTDAGLAFHDKCIDTLRLADDAISNVQAVSRAVDGTLRITAPLEFGNMHIAPLLPAIRRAHPGLVVSMLFSNRVVDLAEEGVDVAVRIAQKLDTQLAGRQVAASRLMLVASPAYLAANGLMRQPKEITRHPALCFSVGRWDTWSFKREDQEIRIKVAPALQSTSSEGLRQCALHDGGIALLPSFLVGEDVRAGRLRQVLPGWDMGTLNIYALYPQRKHHPARLRVFIDSLVAHFGEQSTRDPF
jgi:DNA-binding transcriptional LysR family regulator